MHGAHAREAPLRRGRISDKLKKKPWHASGGHAANTTVYTRRPEVRCFRQPIRQRPTMSKEPSLRAHGRNGASVYTGAKKIAVPHPAMKPGDHCPGCEKGKVYPQKEPRTLVRVVGQAPLAATVYERWILCAAACAAKCSPHCRT